MEDNLEEHHHSLNNSKNVFMGLLIGGLVGAAAMLLFAPQSGERTRAQIQVKSIQLRDQTSKKIKQSVAQIRSKTNQITEDVLEKAGELKQLGQDKLVEQLDRMSTALDTGKTEVETA